MSDAVVYVNDNDFNEQVLEAQLPVLLDFWAEWCGPCKMIAPLLDAISEEFAGKLTVAKLNIDESPATPQKYGVRGIPTLMLFKNGEIEATKVGALSKVQLVEFINAHL
ncbi:MAG: thioredoxin TrxA [Methylococcales bacterium]|nr:thioredoxin TrxA [Methylococcales bacterium]MDD5214010.1 thioredoxin TrxA [Methylococcales bacterium]